LCGADRVLSGRRRSQQPRFGDLGTTFFFPGKQKKKTKTSSRRGKKKKSKRSTLVNIFSIFRYLPGPYLTTSPRKKMPLEVLTAFWLKNVESLNLSPSQTPSRTSPSRASSPKRLDPNWLQTKQHNTKQNQTKQNQVRNGQRDKKNKQTNKRGTFSVAMRYEIAHSGGMKYTGPEGVLAF